MEKQYINSSSGALPEYKEIDDERYEFTEETVRKSFIRKVYSILMLQMIVALFFISWFQYDARIKFYVQRNIWPLVVSFVVSFAVLIALMCCGEVRRKAPVNYLLLAVFSLAESFILATVAALYDTKIVMLAVGITAIVFLGLTIFSMQTTYDFTMSGGFLCVALMVLMVFGLLVMFFPGRTLILIYSSIGALLFGFYIVYDTQLLLGGGHQISLSPEEYIFAVLALYLDIINFFLMILNIIGASRR